MAKTTVLLRDDLYALIIAQFGKRELSSAINRILSEKLLKPKEDGFGMLAGVLTPFERDHDDRF